MKHAIYLVALVASATAHSTFQELWVNGVDKAGTCIRTPPSNSPVTTVTSTDIRCNVGGTKGVAGLCSVTGTNYASFSLLICWKLTAASRPDRHG